MDSDRIIAILNAFNPDIGAGVTITALEDEFRAGEAAIEATAAELGVSADEVVGALLEDGEAWGEWSAVGAAL